MKFPNRAARYNEFGFSLCTKFVSLFAFFITEISMKRENQVFGQITSTKDWSKLTKIAPKSTVFVQAAETQGYIRQLLVVIKEKETR